MHKCMMHILINLTNITKIKSVKKMYIISVRRGGGSQIWYIISERSGVKNMVHNFGFLTPLLTAIIYQILDPTSHRNYLPYSWPLYRGSQFYCRRKPEYIMLYWAHLVWAGFELTTSVAIGTDCIGCCKSNYRWT
jgi:hypothetical protein